MLMLCDDCVSARRGAHGLLLVRVLVCLFVAWVWWEREVSLLVLRGMLRHSSPVRPGKLNALLLLRWIVNGVACVVMLPRPLVSGLSVRVGMLFTNDAAMRYERGGA